MNSSEEQIAARREIDKVCSIYKTVGDAMHEEARDRLSLAVVNAVLAAHRKQQSRLQDGSSILSY